MTDQPWRVGAAGEQEVARLLETLAPAWRALHAVPVGRKGSDLDHVVIGPAGIVSVNTKTHRGKTVWVGGRTVRIGGRDQPYIRNALLEQHRVSKAAHRALGRGIPSRAVVAVLGASSWGTGEVPCPEGVCVIPAEHVAQWLLSLPVALSPGEVATLYERLRWASAWSW